MTWWGTPPNAERYRVSSLNLAISRHSATNGSNDDRLANGDRPATQCPASTCQPPIDSIRVALALLFSLS